MPLTKKGQKIMSAMTAQYGSKKGKQVFYASANKGTITGVEKMAYGKKPTHSSPADPDIKRAMMGGHSQSVKENYSHSVPQGDKFQSGAGFKVIPDNGANAMSYGKRKVASSPMMRPQSARKSWRARGDYDRRSRNEA